MIKKIDLVTPYHSQYDVLHYFTLKLYEAWLRAGYTTRYFTDAEDALKTALQDPPDLMVGFNGIPRKNKKYYSDIIKKPYLTLIVDPYFRFLECLSSPYVIMGCDDFSGYAHLKEINFRNVLFMPHAVEPELAPDPQVERIYDISFLATFIDYEGRRKKWKSRYPSLICKTMDEAVEKTFADPLVPFTEAALNKLQLLFQEHPKLKPSKKDIIEILEDIELYIKGKERIDMLKAIQTSPVHVFGQTVDKTDWKKYFINQSNIIVHNAVSFEKSLEIMKRSRITLNSSIKNKFGAHERIFSGVATGALVLTNENVFLKKYFENDIDMAFFKFDQLNRINQTIHSYLSDEEKRQEIAENGREIVMSFHTWDFRIKTLENELFPLIEEIQKNVSK